MCFFPAAAPEVVPGAPPPQTSLAPGSQVCPTSSQGALSPATTTPAKLSNIIPVACNPDNLNTAAEREWKGRGGTRAEDSRTKAQRWEGETRRSRAARGAARQGQDPGALLCPPGDRAAVLQSVD